MKDLLKMANAFVEERKARVDPSYRQSYHAMAPVGWINDPNGFVTYGDKYHLYCQFNPYASQWGPMHWGHWTSRDLIRWDWMSVVLAPDMPYDSSGCFSGHAVIRDDQLIVMYTGVQKVSENVTYQQQCIAESTDGIHFIKHLSNPVIGENDLPEGCSPKDFRDPKIFKVQDGYRVIIACGGVGGGRLLSYFSQDLLTWRYDGIFLSKIGDMLECPDFFELDQQKLLISCVMNMPEQGLQYPNRKPVVYICGTTEDNDSKFIAGLMRAVDFGLDFYAPQTTDSGDGRRIMIGWMQCWGHEFPTHYLGHGWSGSMTLPRELTMENGELIQRPVREIDSYKINETTFSGMGKLSGECSDKAEINIDIAVGEASRVMIRVKESCDEYFLIDYDVKKSIITVDRSHCGYTMGKEGKPEAKPYSCAETALVNGHISMRIFLDVCSVELFVNGGILVMTSLAFPKRFGRKFSVESDQKETLIHITTWDIEII